MASLSRQCQIASVLFLLVVLIIVVSSDDTATTTTAAVETRANVTSSFVDRKTAFHTAIQNANPATRTTYAQIVLAYLGKFPLDENPMKQLVNEAATSSNSDFAISRLVRILFFTDGTNWTEYYDYMILPILREESYWYTTECCGKNDDSMTSENHMIMWFSSAWLLNQREGWSVGGSTLRQRLIHYLTLKINYGYYEFLSASYWPWTLQGLMNLVDFAEDEEIRSFAERAAQRLVADNLLFVNSLGIKYSAAGRDYAERFMNSAPYTLKQDGIIHLLTGLGRAPSVRSVAQNVFVSTSSFNFSDIVAQWEPFVDTTYVYGHTLEESFGINEQLEKYDRIAFQFSQGAYFHPLVAQDTVDFFQHFAPITFEEFGITLGEWIKIIPPSWAPLAASTLDRIGVGSVLSGNTIRLYRSNGSMLSSVLDFWPGHVGYQTFVWMAVCDDVAVWTQSGKVFENWLNKSGTITNSNLPSIHQESNVALILYPAYFSLQTENREVALYWPAQNFTRPAQKFDEVATVVPVDSSDSGNWFMRTLRWIWRLIFGGPSPLGSWILGRRGDSYIAVYCPCGNRTVLGWYACGGDNGRQSWVTVVGDATRYQSFPDFTALIQQAVIQDSSPTFWFRRYSVSITVGGKTITHQV